ncbi:spermidine/putrescine ABC transporter ATP-binding protein PotA [Oxalobacter sp. OttesenSCG-928-P03]|nr:spermidine/putrescine ABC transporter ATP-binding protein PotA [Oxalobacter sp. OttesenSCG-928-P03]
MEKSPIIELRGVSKFYGDTAALHNVNLEIANGEFLTLLGPSGCGKTTILRLISGLEKPSQGELLLNGVSIGDTPPEKRQVNTVFQNYALFPHMTVRDNVAFGLKMRRLPADEIDRKVREVLQRVQMESMAMRMPSQLSGGQQQRVAIARAIVNNPLVLLLDEPFSALDAKLRKQLQLEIKMLQRQLGITFVFVTHDQEEAFAMSDRVVVMNEGAIKQVGSSQQIYEEPENLFVAHFVGEINVLEGTIKSVREDGAYMADVEGVEFPLHSTREHEIGEKVKVLLRPEDLIVYLEKEKALNPPFFTGRIEHTVYKGATVDILLTLDNGKALQAAEFFNEDDEDITYREGDRVTVSWIEGWEVVLDEEGE